MSAIRVGTAYGRALFSAIRIGTMRAAAIVTWAALVICCLSTAAAQTASAHKDSVTTERLGLAAQEDADTTQYESIKSTPYEKAALIGANALLLPLALSAAAISVLPPNFGMMIDDGTAYAALGFETGIGLGTNRETGRFADERLMLNYTHIYNPHRRDIWRIEGVKDVNLFFIDKRKILAFGVSPLVGLYINGADRGYSIGASVRLMLPSLPYFGMFPLHTVGITYRYNKNLNNGGTFHTASFGISAAVIF
ncbi:MAG TPA: hypothetical protein VK470_11280 [Bacteroidota bacterium]|nr:hypothetical protein [Bacteroidota bacterium]